MGYGAQPTAKIGTPPAGEVLWSCIIAPPDGQRGAERMIFVVARSWFAARVKGMALLGCGPEDLTVRETKTVPGEIST